MSGPRDITGRVLSRPLNSPYAPGGGQPSRIHWLWLLPIAWLLWAGFLSDHSLWRISKLRHELASAQSEIRRVHGETAKLEARLEDPDERARHAEEVLRAQGMARPGEIVYRFGGGHADSTARR